MNDDELDDEQWKAQLEAKARAFGGPTLTAEEMEALQKRITGEDSIEKKYPGSNGCEMAILTPAGDVEITQSSRADGAISHGTRLYRPGDKQFQYFWNRHHFDNPKTRTHVIMLKFDDQSKEWTDVGEDWI